MTSGSPMKIPGDTYEEWRDNLLRALRHHIAIEIEAPPAWILKLCEEGHQQVMAVPETTLKGEDDARKGNRGVPTRPRKSD